MFYVYIDFTLLFVILLTTSILHICFKMCRKRNLIVRSSVRPYKVLTSVGSFTSQTDLLKLFVLQGLGYGCVKLLSTISLLSVLLMGKVEYLGKKHQHVQITGKLYRRQLAKAWNQTLNVKRLYSGTCLIRLTKGPGKCVGLYRMSEYSGLILVIRTTLGPYIFVGKLRCRIAQVSLQL